jgi:hypothetical protein
MSVNSGGRFENRSSLEIAPMTAGSLLIDGGVFVNGSSGVMDVGENTISLMLTNGGLFENSGEINVPNSIIFHIDGEADFVNSGILRGGEYQIGLGSTFTNNGVITDEAFFQNQGTYTGTGDFSGYFTGGRVHPGNPIGTMFFDANGSIWPLQIEFAKNESKEIIHDSVTWIGYCNVSGTIVEPTFTEGMSEDDLVDGASFEILSCEADPGEYFMVTLDHSTAPLEFGDWGLDLDYDLQSRELIVYLTYEIDTTDIDTPLLPESFALRGAYPNPFNPSTTIAYDLPTAVPVKLHVYDIAGRVVRVLRDGSVELPGSHKVVWNGQDDAGRTVSSGTYFCRLIAGEYVQIRSLMLVR